MLVNKESDVKTILSKKNLKDHKVYEKFKILNRFIEPEEEKELFLNTDYVWCVYKNTPLGSSGVFHLSCNYKKPVITNNDGLWVGIIENIFLDQYVILKLMKKPTNL